MLKQKQIDGALVCRTVVVDGIAKPEFFIAQNLEELKSAQGSKYMAVHFTRDAMPLIKAFHGKLAVVALPCDTHILRRYCLNDPQIAQKILLIITLFCGHNSELELTEAVAQKLAPPNTTLTNYRHRFGTWRGNLKVEFSDGCQVVKPFSYFSDYQNLYFFCQPKCHHCHDHTGYESDISVGDIWSMRMKSNPIKHNALITRTAIGEELVQEALLSGVLIGQEEPIGEICEGQARTMPFHYNISARAKVGKLFGLKIEDSLHEKVHWYEYLTACLVLFNERLSRSKSGQKWIIKAPRFIHKAALYFMKGLESLHPFEKKGSIAIIGGTIWGNRGAEAMLVTTIGRIREVYPQAHFNVFSYYPQHDRELINDPQVRILNSKPISLVLKHFPFALLEAMFNLIGIHLPGKILPKEVKALRESSVLLDIGGITFSDGRELFLPFNMITIWPAMMLNTPVVKMAQALGPFQNPLNRLAARLFLPKCDHIFARGEKTADHLAQLPLDDKKWDRVVDIAFLYEPEYSLTNENEERVNALELELKRAQETGDRILAFSPSSLVLKESEKRGTDYPLKFLDIIRSFQNESCRFVVLPNATREGSDKERNNDILAIQTIRARAQAELSTELNEKIEWMDFDINTRSIRRIIARSDVLVTSRYHAMIAGLSLAVPTVVLGWGHKYAETLADFGVQHFSADFNDPAVDFISLVKEALEKREEIHTQIDAGLKRVRSISETQFKYLEKFLN
jgi:coenzyme F420-reducing hydrogenase beta subunit/polysaccharide pyruvyl transferase WcaK-like protein